MEGGGPAGGAEERVGACCGFGDAAVARAGEHCGEVRGCEIVVYGYEFGFIGGDEGVGRAREYVVSVGGSWVMDELGSKRGGDRFEN